MNGNERERRALIQSIRDGKRAGYDNFYLLEKAETWKDRGKITDDDFTAILDIIYPEETGEDDGQDNGNIE